MRLRIVVTAIAALLATASAAWAQADYPNRPVRLIVGFPPGSSADIAARVVGNRMSQLLGQQVVVESKPGAASSIAAAEVARAPKDGYTLFMLSSANIANELINPALQFNIVRDFAPVALVNTTAVILTVHPSTGASDLKGLIALAKAKPGELNYASTGPGTAPHLSGELLAQRAGIKIVHVPYKGSPEAATDLLAGRVSMMFSPASAVIAQGKEGKLKLLATATGKRLSILPDVPTMAEAGWPTAEVVVWAGVMAPAGTPRVIIRQLERAFVEASLTPETRERLVVFGADPVGAGSKAFAEVLEKDLALWQRVAQASGVKVE